MCTLGIHVYKGAFRYAALEGDKANPKLVKLGRAVTTDPAAVPSLMDWYDTQFRLLIDSLKPEKIAYRLTLEPKKEQLFTSEFPLGVLNLIAHSFRLPITPYTSPAFVPSRLGLTKGLDLYEHCDLVFGKHPPHWDREQKHAILVAWFEL